MALTECRECGKTVSDRAFTCPQCGSPVAIENMAKPREYESGNGSVHTWKPWVAGVLSVFIPGLGQLYKGQWAAAVIWFLAVLAGYSLIIIPGTLLHIFCVLGAVFSNPEPRTATQRRTSIFP